MTKQNLCLEEYIEYLKTYTPEGDPLTVSCDSGKFLIYYVPADNSKNTTIYVPKKAQRIDTFACEDTIISGMYTVSGNNKDGFIVTVAK